MLEPVSPMTIGAPRFERLASREPERKAPSGLHTERGERIRAKRNAARGLYRSGGLRERETNLPGRHPVDGSKRRNHFAAWRL